MANWNSVQVEGRGDQELRASGSVCDAVEVGRSSTGLEVKTPAPQPPVSGLTTSGAC